ncbi:S9 family peptidase [Cyclonatronum proteinivorum]|uniref:S9 family peptidase n=1 Tax=Cyclonatronum proteinivorum TaxID=1457365 RepID=UPI0013DFD9F7|nr:prolyl oligopeptidase family serine peptidase [Cyclonatronum proteinivorum]
MTAQTGTDDAVYQMPPEEVVAIVDAPATPAVSLSPNREYMMLMHRAGLPGIIELAQPELRLAGIRINPRTNGPSRASGFTGLALVDMANGEEIAVSGLPDDASIGSVSWSPDGTRFAFTNTTLDAVELWMGSVASRSVSLVPDIQVNDTYFGSSLSWHPSSEILYVRAVPAGRGDAPEPELAPRGPVIQENIGRSAPARTYQDMLSNAHDEALFEYYFTAQIKEVQVTDFTRREVGEAGIIRSMSPAPGGAYLMVAFTDRPFSYTVPASRFPVRTEIWDTDGNVVETVAEIPLQNEIPIGFNATSVGPRSITWRNDAPATVVWVEAQDEGNPRVEADTRDLVFMQEVPFTGAPDVLARLEYRFSGIMWGHGELALIRERWFDNRNERLWRVAPDNIRGSQLLVWDRNYEDIYNDPGSPQMRVSDSGNMVLNTDDSGFGIFLTALGASDEGNRPFLDRLDLTSEQTERLWQSASPFYERVVTMLDNTGSQVITLRESQTVPANYFQRDLSADTEIALTQFEHPNPDLRDVRRELVTYERADGVPLSGTLLLPPGYDPETDGRLPLMVWAYPREFRSADAAGQRSDSPYRFVNIGYWGPQWLITQGYAVLDAATMPIVGEGDKEPNDTFIDQLIMNSEAAIDAVADMGIADPNRAAIGGHSYGAFMVAHILGNSDLFRAGIARSGAYNRSLTPFGFQREQRTLWDDTNLYITMSPFFNAHNIKHPILLIHGEADNNSGTFPLQSERLFQAIQGLGGTARLVMLPHESHGYRARESVMHMLWETHRWLDKFVKHADELTEAN